MNNKTTELELDLTENIGIQDDGSAVFMTTQTLGDDFFDHLDEAKEAFRMRLDGYTPVASVPEYMVNKWIREGFDFWNAPANEIARKLRLEEATDFIISGDKTFDH